MLAKFPLTPPYRIPYAEGIILSQTLKTAVEGFNMNKLMLCRHLNISRTGLYDFIDRGAPVRSTAIANRIVDFLNEEPEFHLRFLHEKQRNSIETIEKEVMNKTNNKYPISEPKVPLGEGKELSSKLSDIILINDLNKVKVAKEIGISDSAMYNFCAGFPVRRQDIADKITEFVTRDSSSYESLKLYDYQKYRIERQKQAFKAKIDNRIRGPIVQKEKPQHRRKTAKSKVKEILQKMEEIKFQYKIQDTVISSFCGVHPTSLSKWRRRKFVPNPKALEKLAEFITLPAAQLNKLSLKTTRFINTKHLQKVVRKAQNPAQGTIIKTITNKAPLISTGLFVTLLAMLIVALFIIGFLAAEVYHA